MSNSPNPATIRILRSQLGHVHELRLIFDQQSDSGLDRSESPDVSHDRISACQELIERGSLPRGWKDGYAKRRQQFEEEPRPSNLLTVPVSGNNITSQESEADIPKSTAHTHIKDLFSFPNESISPSNAKSPSENDVRSSAAENAIWDIAEKIALEKSEALSVTQSGRSSTREASVQTAADLFVESESKQIVAEKDTNSRPALTITILSPTSTEESLQGEVEPSVVKDETSANNSKHQPRPSWSHGEAAIEPEMLAVFDKPLPTPRQSSVSESEVPVHSDGLRSLLKPLVADEQGDSTVPDLPVHAPPTPTNLPRASISERRLTRRGSRFFGRPSTRSKSLGRRSLSNMIIGRPSLPRSSDADSKKKNRRFSLFGRASSQRSHFSASSRSNGKRAHGQSLSNMTSPAVMTTVSKTEVVRDSSSSSRKSTNEPAGQMRIVAVPLKFEAGQPTPSLRARSMSVALVRALTVPTNTPKMSPKTGNIESLAGELPVLGGPMFLEPDSDLTDNLKKTSSRASAKTEPATGRTSLSRKVLTALRNDPDGSTGRYSLGRRRSQVITEKDMIVHDVVQHRKMVDRIILESPVMLHKKKRGGLKSMFASRWQLRYCILFPDNICFYRLGTDASIPTEDDVSAIEPSEIVSTHKISELLTKVEGARKFRITIRSKEIELTFRLDSETKGEKWATELETLHSQDEAKKRLRDRII